MNQKVLGGGSFQVAVLIGLFAVGCAPSDGEPGGSTEKSGKEGAALVDSIYTVDGWMSLVDDYIPRVCTQENGGADGEALKVQAIAARTYVLRSIRDDSKLGTTSEPIENGQQFQ